LLPDWLRLLCSLLLRWLDSWLRLNLLRRLLGAFLRLPLWWLLRPRLRLTLLLRLCTALRLLRALLRRSLLWRLVGVFLWLPLWLRLLGPWLALPLRLLTPLRLRGVLWAAFILLFALPFVLCV
jgi:hypothetical protein